MGIYINKMIVSGGMGGEIHPSDSWDASQLVYRVGVQDGTTTALIPGLNSVDDEIDWGDGTKSHPASASDESITHEYSDGLPTHLVRISGGHATSLNGWSNTAYVNTVTEVLNWPRTLSGFRGTSFGGWYSYAKDRTFLTSVDLGNSSITTFSGGNYRFYRNVNLSKVVLPPNLTHTGTNTFTCCTSLKSISIPRTVTTLGDSSFSQTGLEEVWVPEGVTTMENHVFSNCHSLRRARIPSTLTSLNYSTFMMNTTYGNKLERVEWLARSFFASSTFHDLGRGFVLALTPDFQDTKGVDSADNLNNHTFRNCWLTGIEFTGSLEQWNANSALTTMFGTATANGELNGDGWYSKSTSPTISFDVQLADWGE